MHTRRTISAGLAALALAPAAYGKPKPVLPTPPPLSTLAGFRLRRPDGLATTLGAEIPAGRPAVITLWATWCGPCFMEARHLSTLRKRIAEDRLAIIAINIDEKNENNRRTDTRINQFLEAASANYTQLRGSARPVFDAFIGGRQRSIPRLFVYDASGVSAATFAGSSSEVFVQIDQAVDAVLASSPAQIASASAPAP